MSFMVKFNTNFYSVDSIEVIEVELQLRATRRGDSLYRVNVHTKSGKTFIVFEDQTF